MEQVLSFFNNKKILVTGGGGYLGSKLAEYLIRGDSEIFLLDINFNAISQSLFNNHSFVKKVICDLSDYGEVQKAINYIQPKVIFHFGALLNRERDFTLYDKLYAVNVLGTANILNSLKDIEYEGFYFASTSEVYGTQNSTPFKENMIPIPPSPYSLTKLMAENFIRSYSEVYQKPYSIFRIFNFFGFDMPESFFINQLISALHKNKYFEMTSGKQERDFLCVHDLITSIIIVAGSGKRDKEIFNICNGNGIALDQLAITIAGYLNKMDLLKIGAIPYRKNEIWKMIGDNEKIIKHYPHLKSFLTGNLSEKLIAEFNL